MFSVNAPVPGAVKRTVDDLRPLLGETRTDHTLVVKRLSDDGRRAGHRERIRRALDGHPTMRARIDGIETFTEPVNDTAPVVYLAVDSPGLVALHDRLCDVVDPVPEVEGDAYVPHVTVGRLQDENSLEEVRKRGAPSVSWTITELVFWDARHQETVSRISLPG